MFNWKAIEKYNKIKPIVRRSKKYWAEPGEPSKLLVFAKLERPTSWGGTRIPISVIKNKLIKIPAIVNINRMV